MNKLIFAATAIFTANAVRLTTWDEANFDDIAGKMAEHHDIDAEHIATFKDALNKDFSLENVEAKLSEFVKDEGDFKDAMGLIKGMYHEKQNGGDASEGDASESEGGCKDNKPSFCYDKLIDLSHDNFEAKWEEMEKVFNDHAEASELTLGEK